MGYCNFPQQMIANAREELALIESHVCSCNKLSNDNTLRSSIRDAKQSIIQATTIEAERAQLLVFNLWDKVIQTELIDKNITNT